MALEVKPEHQMTSTHLEIEKMGQGKEGCRQEAGCRQGGLVSEDPLRYLSKLGFTFASARGKGKVFQRFSFCSSFASTSFLFWFIKAFTKFRIFFPKGGNSSLLILFRALRVPLAVVVLVFGLFVLKRLLIVSGRYDTVLIKHTNRQVLGFQRNSILANKAWDHLVLFLCRGLPSQNFLECNFVHAISQSPPASTRRRLISMRISGHELPILYSSWVAFLFPSAGECEHTHMHPSYESNLSGAC